jgi:hypothetical protein
MEVTLHRSPSIRGYSTVEILVATFGALLTVASLAGGAQAQSRLYARETTLQRLREAERRVLAMMRREIRGAGYAPVAGGSFDGEADALAIARTDWIELRADRHGPTGDDPPDGILESDSDERVGFYRNRTRDMIYESLGEEKLSLTSGVVAREGSLGFAYFDACDRPIAMPAGGELAAADRHRVRRVAVTLRLADPASGAEAAAEASAVIRNRLGLACEAPS